MAGGSYNLTWRAADPAVNRGPLAATYEKLTPAEWLARFGAYPQGAATSPLANAQYAAPGGADDSVASLAPKNMELGQIVPFFVEIRVSGSTAPENGVIEFRPYWLTKTTNGSDFGFDPNFQVLAAFVDRGDPDTLDANGSASVLNVTSNIANANTSNEQIQSTIRVGGLENGDRVIVEIWVALKPTIPSSAQGNVQTGLISARTASGDTISTGNQTIPLLRAQEFFSSEADLSIIQTDSLSSGLTAGDDALQVRAGAAEAALAAQHQRDASL